jgi:dipeptidyl aminopeptidase/acylaminoacyl peptidase
MRVSLNKYLFIVLLAILLEMAAAWPACSQTVEKLPLTRSDYKRWGRLRMGNMSTDSRHISFTMHYPGGKDTLFVKDVRSGATISMAGAHNGQFTSNGHFIFKDLSNVLTIRNLNNGQRWVATGVNEFSYLDRSQTLLYFADENNRPYLGIKKLNQNKDVKIWDVTDYAYNEKAGVILCSRKFDKTTDLIAVHTTSNQVTEKVLLSGMPGELLNIVWEPDGRSAAFLQVVSEGANPSIHSYKLDTGVLTTFDPSKSLPPDWKVSTEKYANVKVLPKGEQILFKVYYDGKSASTGDSVQVWNAADKYLYPVHRRTDGGVKYAKLAVWSPQQGHFKIINDNTQSEVMMAGNGRYAILSAPEMYEPQWNYDALRDFYIEDLQTGEKKLLLERQSIEWGHISVSPGSWFVTYFSKGDWWIYDVLAGHHRNITASLGSDFARDDMDVTSGTVAWGMGGWTDNDHFALFYDRYDIWIHNIKDGTSRRMSKGKEDGLVYRVALPQNGTGNQSNYDGQTARLLSGKEIFLDIKGKGRSGYCLFNLVNGCISQEVKQKRITAMVKGIGTTIAYVEEDFDQPPAIMINKDGRSKKVFQSNPHHINYQWGKSELITYRNSKGQQLHAALYYPAGYNPKIRYPMVVYIYDKQADLVHNYVIPSMENSNGFNAANFTSSGYFVLVPDIAYEVGNPGYSATDCVVSLTKEVISKNIVDPRRIGLIGHSYGGYETNFIITQTDIFAAAVAGAAITDLQSSYLYASWNYKKPNFWHYEYNQLRMGGSIFNNFLGFVSNSPVYHAEKINTPLLSWTGEDDRQVHYFQSIELYLALRRLGKKHIMLIYSGEGHALSDQSAQFDLTEKIEAWFGHYLKDNELPTWTKADLPR